MAYIKIWFIFYLSRVVFGGTVFLNLEKEEVYNNHVTFECF